MNRLRADRVVLAVLGLGTGVCAAEPARLGIGGWSCGGILTHYSIAGGANQLSTYGSDEYILQYANELGPPWRNPALSLEAWYPFLHADRIHTPTLFVGGAKDFNVPVVGGPQRQQALGALGVPAQPVVYPGLLHSITRPGFRKHRAGRAAAWFGRDREPGR